MENNVHKFLAGAANVDITPPLGTYINGDFIAHYARYIHDPLHARALVIQNDQTTIAIVVVDICVMPRDFIDGVKAEITRQTGIAASNIMISATHTHAAGSVASVYLGAADMQYMRKLPALIVRSVVEAKQNLSPAKVAWGSVDVPEHVLCRRYKMKSGYKPVNPVNGGLDGVKTNPFGAEDLIDSSNAATDPEVGFLAVRGLDDKWIAVLANYSLHYVGDWDNGTISADYFGEFSRQLQGKLRAGDNFAGIMSNGTSGNINIWDFKDPNRYPTAQFEKSKLIGGDIANKVYQQLQTLDWDESPQLASQYTDLDITLRKPTASEVAEAVDIVKQTDYARFELSEQTLKQLYAREQVLLNDLPNEDSLPLQAIRIGKGMIGGICAEIFAETGLWLKQQSPLKNYFTISLANGNAGYVPPAHEFTNGGYETWRGRTSKLQTDAEELIKKELLAMINTISNTQ